MRITRHLAIPQSANADSSLYTREPKSAVSVSVIASGGVSSVADVSALKNTGVEGAIIGKALYTDNIKLKDALAAAE